MRKSMLLMGMLLIMLLAACGGGTPTATLTPVVIVPTDVPPLPTPGVTPSVTVEILVPQLETATPSPSPAPPTETPTATETLGPYEHTIQSNETLGYIVQLYGYTDLSVGTGGIIDQVVLTNGLANADFLPGAGTVLLIPRQTATPTPQNAETAVAADATNVASVPNVVLADNASEFDYVVQEGDTIISIASEYNLTLEIIAVLNPELDFFSCNFEIPSGGPGCNVPLIAGAAVKLPAPTPTPTLSPTPSGSETPTPTPTYEPPRLVFPPQGGVALPAPFSLQWVGVGVLDANEFYLVEVTDTTANVAPFREVTKATSLLLPESLIPSDGQTHTFNWTVRVVTPNEAGVYRTIGGTAEIRSFQWQSR